MWRRRSGLGAELLLLLLLVAPRCTCFMLWVVAPDLIRSTFSFLGVGAYPLAAPVFRLLPQLGILVCATPLASDSFWWTLALAHCAVQSLCLDFEIIRAAARWLLAREQRRRQRRQVEFFGKVVQRVTPDVFMMLTAGALALVGGLLGKEVFAPVANTVMAWSASQASTAPLLHWERRRYREAAMHLAVVVWFAAQSENPGLDYPTLVCMAGPFAVLVAKVLVQLDIYQVFGSGAASVPMDHGSTVIIERSLFFESSMMALARLGPTQLQGDPFVIYCTSSLSPMGSRRAHFEEGVDVGGLRRDWLGRLAGELFDPARGLVEHAVVSGVSTARLKPGANLRELESLGKVLGLALRDGQPLGVDLCPPLAHLLAHPSLPEVLELISSDAPEKGRERLSQLGFCREWLQWVSQEEYRYKTRQLYCLRRDRTLGGDGELVEVSPDPARDMERRALQVLILDVVEETKAVWRGLRAVPRVPLPNFEDEVRGSKRRATVLEGEEGEAPRSGTTADTAAGASARLRACAAAPSSVSVLADGGGVRSHARQLEEALARPAKRRRLGDGGVMDDGIALSAHGAAAAAAATAADDEALHAGADELSGRSILQTLLAGDRSVSASAWRACTRITPPGAEHAPEGQQIVAWFWAYVESLDSSRRSLLLDWVTGYRRIPAGGFPPPHKTMNLHLQALDGSRRLPSAHTCALQLNIPRHYTSEDDLRLAFTEAIAHQQFLLA